MTSYVTVTTIKDGVVNKTILIVAENNIVVNKGNCNGKNINNVAEEVFAAECAKIDSDFPDISDEELSAILDNGYFEANEQSVCLCHPDLL